MTITKQWCVAASIAVLLGLACSSTPPAQTTPTAGFGSAFPTAGVGQAVTAAGAGAPTAGTLPPAPPSMVQCGPKVCMGTGLLAAVFAPCCADNATGTCGTLSGTVCTPTPMTDMRCPTVTILGTTPAPCCTPTGMCGVDGSMLGMGCSDLAMVKLILPTAPPPQRCDGMPLPMAGDGAQGTSGIGAAGVTGVAGVGVAAGSGGIGATAGVGSGAGGRGTAGMSSAGTGTAGMSTAGVSSAGRGGVGSTAGIGGGISGH